MADVQELAIRIHIISVASFGNCLLVCNQQPSCAWKRNSTSPGMLGLKPGTLRKRFFGARAKLQRAIVQKAEENGQLDLLPKEFANCVSVDVKM
jgi:hypothetical protein